MSWIASDSLCAIWKVLHRQQRGFRPRVPAFTVLAFVFLQNRTRPGEELFIVRASHLGKAEFGNEKEVCITNFTVVAERTSSPSSRPRSFRRLVLAGLLSALALEGFLDYCSNQSLVYTRATCQLEFHPWGFADSGSTALGVLCIHLLASRRQCAQPSSCAPTRLAFC